MKISERFKKFETQVNRRGIILMYHRVANLEHDPWWLSISPAHFEEQMQVLQKYGRPRKMRDMGRNLKRFSFGPKEIIVTFDDGYADNFHNARPILEKYGIPATFFITTGIINKREEFWWDEIGRLTFAAKNLPEKFEMTIAGTRYEWQINSAVREAITEEQAVQGIYPNKTTLSKERLHYVLWQIISKLPMEEKKLVLQEIAKWAKQSSEPRADNLAMTWVELESLASSKLFEIGAHTVNHPMLPQLNLEKQEEEMRKSKNTLEEMIGQTIVSFAYPHGEYVKETVDILRSLGFEYACTVKGRSVTRNSDPLLLPRYGVLDWDGDQFEKHLKGYLNSKGG